MQPCQTTPENRTDGTEIESRIGHVGQRLSFTMRDVLSAIPGGPHRPQELARVLGVTKDLSSRTLKAASTKDPLAVAYLMPGPASLRQLLRAAAKKKVAPELIREAEIAVRQFDQLIRIDAGDRISLDGIISAWLPDARERFEMGNKQAVFRGMAQLKGVMADVGLTTAIVHPAADGKSLDGVWLLGSIGLRRTRPGCKVHFSSRQIGPSSKGCSPRTLDGELAEDLDGLLLKPFCSSPIPQMDVQHEGSSLHYTLAGNAIGPDSAVDLVVAEFTPQCMERYTDPQSPQKRGPSSAITTPVKTLIFDVLLHEDAYPGSDPTLSLYETAASGAADVNDRTRDIDRLDLAESVEFLGWNTDTFRVSEIPQYTQMIRSACDKMGWDGRKFRGYRCRAQYPVYGSQFAMAFDPPQKA